MPERRSFRGIRKHRHFRVTVNYSGGEQSVSGKVFNNRENADEYAARQKKSSVVKSAKVEQTN
jgi:hypothetical protein